MSTASPYTRLCVNGKAERPADRPRTKTEKNVPAEDEMNQSSVDQSPSKCPLPRHDRGERVAEEQHSPKCPFGYDSVAEEQPSLRCPFGYDSVAEEQPSASPKCPYGYDSVSFKIGPLSCVICRALLFDTSRCVPCQHIFCRVCISRFQDCVVCGADIEAIAADPELQSLVERFIEGHARIKRPPVPGTDGSDLAIQSPPSSVVSYEDVSWARGSFLVQHAIRAFQAQNYESAQSRLRLCAEDIREEMVRTGSTNEMCSQLGTVLGMLGDCCRSIGDTAGAMANYQESVEFLSDLPHKGDDVVHTLSVSLNKLGDLKYSAEDLDEALAIYSRALHLRQQGTDLTKISSQMLDVAVSMAKVADVNRALGSRGAAAEGFQKALKILEGCTPANAKEATLLEPRRLSVLEFLHNQLAPDKSG